MRLPDFFSPLFRNYDIQKIDLEEQKKMIVKTTLTRGTWEQIRWLFRYYGLETIKEVFLDDFNGLRELPEPVINLWGLLFLDEEAYKNEINRQKKGDRLEKWRGRRSVPVAPEPRQDAGRTYKKIM
ncbi:MAG TPA: hypothetical protein GXX19_11065 [Syntrophomonadaceae bacterium]|nr:hypothetical protein [Syntrophomonadaceae bacterium]